MHLLFKYFIWIFLNLSLKVIIFFLCLNIWSGMWPSEYYLYKLRFLLSSDNRLHSQAHRGELESQWRQLLFSVVGGITGSSFSLLLDSYCLPCDLCMSICERDLEEVCFFYLLVPWLWAWPCEGLISIKWDFREIVLNLIPSPEKPCVFPLAILCFCQDHGKSLPRLEGRWEMHAAGWPNQTRWTALKPEG